MKPQKEFPYYQEFKNKFPVDENTVFVYKDEVYCDSPIPSDIMMHEYEHMRQQKKIGADEWIKKYLEDDKFRLMQEVLAYRVQINYWRDREARNICKRIAATNLSSPLYGGIMTYQEALNIL